jgi:hypothetical protein
MLARYLNTIGLVLTIVGCVLVFCFGVPVDVDPEGRIRIIAEQRDDNEIAKGKRYLRLGRLGISLIALGAVFQIWATWAA